MATDPFSFFAPLSDLISLYTPPSHAQGELLVMCAWFRAPDKHIAKYIAFYRKHFPSSKILLLRVGLGSLVKANSKQQVAMRPAVNVILDVISECDSAQDTLQKMEEKSDETKEHMSSKVSPKILLHIFSTGGAGTATMLLLELNKHMKGPAPVVGIVCDSAPSWGSYQSAVTGFMDSTPDNILTRGVSFVAVHILFAILHINRALGRYDYPEHLFWATLAEEKLWADPEGGKNRIAYIASKADKVTLWKDVVRHANEMKEKGWGVEELLYEETPHCNHMSRDEDAYFRVMRRVWEKAKL